MTHLSINTKMEMRFFMPCKTHQEYEDLTEMRSEQRSEHINVPDYVQANAQRGLDNLDRAGDGLVERTPSVVVVVVVVVVELALGEPSKSSSKL